MLPFGYDGFMTRDSSLTRHSDSSHSPSGHLRSHRTRHQTHLLILHPTSISPQQHDHFNHNHHHHHHTHSHHLDIPTRTAYPYSASHLQSTSEPPASLLSLDSALLIAKAHDSPGGQGQPTWPPSSQSPHSCGTRFTIGLPSRLQVVSTLLAAASSLTTHGAQGAVEPKRPSLCLARSIAVPSGHSACARRSHT